MRWLGTAASAAAIGLTLVGCGSSHKSYVTVPLRAQQTSIVGAYDLLHRLGLRVELTRQTVISSLYEPSAKLFPRAGTRVPRDSAVQITPTGGPRGSPAVLKSNPHYRVPDFTGRLASAAIRWAEDHRMFWSIPELPALQASDAPHLFDAYRVAAQQPKPGGTIVQGVMVGHGFKPTPLTLTVVQTSR
jgi:beta-lactam-binding protein with PASTA domain